MEGNEIEKSQNMEITNRVTEIQGQIRVLEVQQVQVSTRLDKHELIIDSINAWRNASDNAAIALREQTSAIQKQSAKQDEQIVHLQTQEVDLSKIAAAHEITLKDHEKRLEIHDKDRDDRKIDIVASIRYAGVLIVSLIVSYLFSHFIK